MSSALLVARDRLRRAANDVPSWLVPTWMGLITDLSLRILAGTLDPRADAILLSRVDMVEDVVAEYRALRHPAGRARTLGH